MIDIGSTTLLSSIFFYLGFFNRLKNGQNTYYVLNKI